MGIVVLPRSEDLVLERFRIETEPGSPAPMAANCDGVHIAGLCGKLVMRDCVFSGLGDDALNIHSTAATVAACDAEKERLLCRYTKRNPDGRLPLTWCRSGDRVAVLDTETARTKGHITVRDFDGDHLLYADADCEILAGDRLQNTAFAAAVTVEGCEIRNTRARALLLQTEQIAVRNCRFFGLTLPALLAAPDLKKWHEVGPVRDMTICRNTFVKCGFSGTAGEIPVIAVQACHDTADTGDAHVHRNICVRDNVFAGKSGRVVRIAATDGVVMEGNRLEHYTAVPGCAPYETPGCTGVSCAPDRGEEGNGNILASDRD